MTADPLHVVVIIGSTRSGRLGPAVAEWFCRHVRQRLDLSLDVVDAGETVEAGRLAAADAFVLVTPEYNHSFPAPLKDLIDRFTEPWHAKPVGFVAYGGISGGLRAVEQLRLVFAELHATTLRDSVSFHGVWSCFGDDGVRADLAAGDAAAKILLDRLTWWARALSEARAARPYSE